MGKENKNMKGTYFISSISITSSIVEFGISSIFILFLLDVLNFSMPLSSKIYAYYYGFAYLLPIIVGYVSDKYLSKSTSLTIGFISMIISQIFLCYTASLYPFNHTIQDTLIFNRQTIAYMIGLFFLALGLSFSTLSITHIINSINNDEDSVVDGFSIFYTVLNIGVLIGVIIMSVIVGDENFELYGRAFALFAIILTIGLISFRLFKNKYLFDNNGNPMEDEHSKNSIKNVSDKILSYLSKKSISDITNLNLRQRRNLFYDSITPHEKDRLTLFMIFLVIIIFYRIAYSQTTISVVFFIDGFVQRDIGDYILPVQLFSIFNPVFVLILSPTFIKINHKLKEKGFDLGFINRTILAILAISFCFIIMASIGYCIDIGAADKISFVWIIIYVFFMVISELYFAIAGYSMVGNLAPGKYYSMFFGLFTATRAIAMFISGRISSHFPSDDPTIFISGLPIDGLMGFFMIFVIMNLFAAAILIIFRKKLKAKLHPEDFNETN